MRRLVEAIERLINQIDSLDCTLFTLIQHHHGDHYNCTL